MSEPNNEYQSCKACIHHRLCVHRIRITELYDEIAERYSQKLSNLGLTNTTTRNKKTDEILFLMLQIGSMCCRDYKTEVKL